MSTLTIELDNETEYSLKQLCLQEGRRREEIASQLISGAMRSKLLISPHEILLLQGAREELSAALWKRYRKLLRQLRAEKITPEEYAELIKTGDRIEIHHSKRLEAVKELASIWNYDFEKTRELLGVGSRANG